VPQGSGPKGVVRRRTSTRLVRTAKDVEHARRLLREYREWLWHHREVTAFPDSVLQAGLAGLDHEIELLPGAYESPGGALVLGLSGTTPVGCGALRRLRRGVGEIKRVYVRPDFRGRGLGHRITGMLLGRARSLGYQRAVLDTLPTMKSAIDLYRKMGFVPIPPYWRHPVPGALFFEYGLQGEPARAKPRRGDDLPTPAARARAGPRGSRSGRAEPEGGSG